MGHTACRSACQCGQSNGNPGQEGSHPSRSGVSTKPFVESSELVIRHTVNPQPLQRTMRSGVSDLAHVVQGDDEVEVDSVEVPLPPQITRIATGMVKLRRFQTLAATPAAAPAALPALVDAVSANGTAATEPSCGKRLVGGEAADAIPQTGMTNRYEHDVALGLLAHRAPCPSTGDIRMALLKAGMPIQRSSPPCFQEV